MAARHPARRQPEPRPGPGTGGKGQPRRAARSARSWPERETTARRPTPDGPVRRASAVPARRAWRGSSGARRSLAGDQREPAHRRTGAREGSRPGAGNAGAGVRCPGGGAHFRAAAAAGALRQDRVAAGLPGRLPATLVGYRSPRLGAQYRRIGPGRNRRHSARSADGADGSHCRTAPGHHRADTCPRARNRPHPLVRRREEARSPAARCQAHPHADLRRTVGTPCPADRRDRGVP